MDAYASGEIMKHNPTPWALTFIDKLPYGYKIHDANGELIAAATAVCHSSKQKTLEDNRNGVGFKYEGEWSREFAIKAIAQQEETARYIVASANACEGARSATLTRGLLTETAINVMQMQMQLTALSEFAITIKDFVQNYPHDTGLHDAAVVALQKLGVL